MRSRSARVARAACGRIGFDSAASMDSDAPSLVQTAQLLDTTDLEVITFAAPTRAGDAIVVATANIECNAPLAAISDDAGDTFVATGVSYPREDGLLGEIDGPPFSAAPSRSFHERHAGRGRGRRHRRRRIAHRSAVGNRRQRRVDADRGVARRNAGALGGVRDVLRRHRHAGRKLLRARARRARYGDRASGERSCHGGGEPAKPTHRPRVLRAACRARERTVRYFVGFANTDGSIFGSISTFVIVSVVGVVPFDVTRFIEILSPWTSL